MEPKLLISIVALTVSIVSLSWNILNYLNSQRKKLKIEAHKVSDSLVVTITNRSKKSLFLRRFELLEKNGKELNKVRLNSTTKNELEAKPLNPEEWRTFIFKEDKYLNFKNEQGKLKKTKLAIFDSTKKKYSTGWFTQNNFR